MPTPKEEIRRRLRRGRVNQNITTPSLPSMPNFGKKLGGQNKKGKNSSAMMDLVDPGIDDPFGQRRLWWAENRLDRLKKMSEETKNRELPKGWFKESAFHRWHNPFKMAERAENRNEAIRAELDANIQNVSDDQTVGGTMPTDRNLNVAEGLVSNMLGRKVRFADVPNTSSTSSGSGSGSNVDVDFWDNIER